MEQQQESIAGRSGERGVILIFNIVVIFIFSIVMVSALAYATAQLRLVRSTVARELAFQVAEAGVNYYQWHLAHFPTDFYDGNASSTSPGPYVRTYVDKDTNQTIGSFSLRITPPPIGSTVTIIESTGWAASNPNTKRKITVRYGVPSLAKFAFVTNSSAWIGDTEVVGGPFHANGGVRFDGVGNSTIASARSTYSCAPWSGCSPTSTKNGIWGTAPTTTQQFWQFPLPSQDFAAITGDLASMKNDAQDDGLYLAPSNTQGYSLVFNASGTVSVYKVNTLLAHATGWDVNNVAHNEDLDYNTRTLQFTQAMPVNGIIYVEDRTWVEGTVNGKVNVIAARLPYSPATAPSIIIPNNIQYLARNGNHVLGLIAQQDILISYNSPNFLTIDAAMFAQNGSAQRFYFPGNLKDTISIFGSVGSYGVWTWSWVSGGTIVSGYPNTSATYDGNLLFGPPPSFPLSTDGYQQLSWTSD